MKAARGKKPSPLSSRIHRALAERADPKRATAMQAYMKSAMPYHGVPMPLVRAVCREAFASYPFDDAATWRADVLALFRGAEMREERYAAVALARHKKSKPLHSLDALAMYEEMITTGAWWDIVDEIATHSIGELLLAHPREMKKTMLAWSKSPDMWKRRTSILCQLTFGKATDLELLFACMKPSLDSKEFFLRKAIGWALRQLARTQPDVVVRFVREHDAVLSGLSKREALKHVQNTR